uniref:Uncharacterized protein n=1 Tax=Romanomermis culicivorax TaxID=13658 RepID=A0A915ICQ3_ROMCU
MVALLSKKRHGHPRVLSIDQEESLVRLIEGIADAGFALTPQQILGMVREYCEVNKICNPLYNPKTLPSKRIAEEPVWQPTRKWFNPEYIN